MEDLAVTMVDFVTPLVAGFIGARFGRLMEWPFPPRDWRRPRQIHARYDLGNAMFWAILTCLVVSSAMTVIDHM